MEGDSGDAIQYHVWHISIKSVMSHLKPPAFWLFVQRSVQTEDPKKKKHQRIVLLAIGEGNPPVIGGFPSQRASNAESVSMP